MEQFKFNTINLQNVCRELKKEINRNINHNDYIEFSIMYDVNKQEFYYCNTLLTQKYESNGDVLYHSYHHYSIDGKVTIKELKTKIFNM